MNHHAKRFAALSLLVLLSGCALDGLWLTEAKSECDRQSGAGSDRLDCYQRAESAQRGGQ